MKKTQSRILSMCICLPILGLVGYGWAQATLDTEVESKQVKAVIDRSFYAINGSDLKLLLAQFSDDAQIDSKVAKGKVSKAVYGEAMSKLFMLRDRSKGEYSGLKVSFPDATHAVAEARIFTVPANATIPASQHEWKLEKRDGRWLIVETNYK